MFCTNRQTFPSASRSATHHASGAKRLAGLLALIVLAVCPAINLSAESYPDQPWGAESAAGRCVVCHSLEKGGPFRVAPNLWNIVGAEKARDSRWYAYSPALITVGGTWTNEELDRFLEDAAAFAPGSTKSVRITDPEERQAIIDFLGQLRD